MRTQKKKDDPHCNKHFHDLKAATLTGQPEAIKRALEQLVTALYFVLLKEVSRFKNVDDAHALVNDAIKHIREKLDKNIDVYNPKKSEFDEWAKYVAYNLWIDNYRAQVRESEHEIPELEDSDNFIEGIEDGIFENARPSDPQKHLEQQVSREEKIATFDAFCAHLKIEDDWDALTYIKTVHEIIKDNEIKAEEHRCAVLKAQSKGESYPPPPELIFPGFAEIARRMRISIKEVKIIRRRVRRKGKNWGFG